MAYNPPLLFYCQFTESFPNSPLPVMLYKGALRPFRVFRRLFTRLTLARNGWTRASVHGISPYHRFHSNNHVVLIVLRGSTVLRLGGYGGQCISIGERDAVIIPAGVAYKDTGADPAFRCLVAWPHGIKGDSNMGLPGERPTADQRIALVPTPTMDPLYGASGALPALWT